MQITRHLFFVYFVILLEIMYFCIGIAMVLKSSILNFSF